MSVSGPGLPSRSAEPHGLGYTLAAVALTLVLGALALAYGFSAWYTHATAPAESAAPSVPLLKTVGAQRYAFLPEMLILPSQRMAGFADRVDLTLPVTLGGDGEVLEMEVAIVPRGRALASARLLDSVYVHQFSQAETSGYPGLVGKPLTGPAAYRTETVWYDPLSVNPFVAKCTPPVDPRAGEATCLRVAQLSDRNLAIFTFPETALRDWRGFDAAVEAALAPLRR